MRSVLIHFIKKRNPNFTLDQSIGIRFLILFTLSIIIKIIRGWSMLFCFRNPKMMMKSSGVKMIYLSKITWGKYLKLGTNVTLSGLGTTGIILGDNVSIGDMSRIITSTSLDNIGKSIYIGHHVGIGEYAYLGGGGGLHIGDECIVGQYFSCHPENHNFASHDMSIRRQGVTRRGISIGKNCWIGSKVTILDGVTIGDGCVIAAGAVVNKSFPSDSILGGVPAKLIGTRN